MYDQLRPMHEIVESLKKDKDSAKKKISGLEKELSGVIDKMRVNKSFSSFINTSGKWSIKACGS